MKDNIILTSSMDGRLGNHCLALYKLFLFAQLNDISFSHIKLPMSKFSPIFGNIRDNFVQDEEIDCFDFANYSSISRSSFSSVDLSKNVRFQHFNWIYPATPEELKLFNYICCPKALKAEVIEKHKEIFSCSNVVGFCIRRGDFKTIIETICPTQVRLLSIEQIKDVIADVFKKFCNDVKILIFSDEIDYLKQHLSLSLSLRGPAT